MPKRIIFTANMPLVAEDMNKLLQDGQIVQEKGQSTTDVMSQKAVIDALSPRTVTVVVGLQSSGYTSDQVDILITPTNNVADKIQKAITKLPSIGGEIKFLEGTYNFLEDVWDIRNNNLMVSGVGTATKLTGASDWLRVYANNIVFNNIAMHRGVDSPVGGIYEQGSATFVNVEITNVLGLNNGVINVAGASYASFNTCKLSSRIDGVTASNWQNIYVNGVAEYVALNSEINTVGNGYTMRQKIGTVAPWTDGTEIEVVLGMLRAQQWEASGVVKTYNGTVGATFEMEYSINTNISLLASSEYIIEKNGDILINIIMPHLVNYIAIIKKIIYRRYLK